MAAKSLKDLEDILKGDTRVEKGFMMGPIIFVLVHRKFSLCFSPSVLKPSRRLPEIPHHSSGSWWPIGTAKAKVNNNKQLLFGMKTFLFLKKTMRFN